MKMKKDKDLPEITDEYLESQLKGTRALGGKPMSVNDKKIIKDAIRKHMEEKRKINFKN